MMRLLGAALRIYDMCACDLENGFISKWYEFVAKAPDSVGMDSCPKDRGHVPMYTPYIRVDA